ncbi:hypothetical protein [Pseudomonas palleroniana]|uniref:Uncharacterized protein n=1 Tax=Pseudomonas palleroniana TaxID=191390 RepID=A0A0X7K4D9_9PSED|nr:hypothetical protein [Pseudomonas palleroniana]KWU50543.1 hypothetical protein AWV77_12895 [Pseudomonas palleroniana]
MPSITSRMSLGEKFTLVISALSFIVGFFGLALSESVSNLYSDAKIFATKDSSNLNSLTGQEGYIGVITISNRGISASEKMKLVISFDSTPPKYEVTSDEEISKSETNGNDIKIFLDRLSKDAKIKLAMYSKLPISYRIQYIDNKGKGPIELEDHSKQDNIKEIILLLVTIISILVIFYIFRRHAETLVTEKINSHYIELQNKISELRDEIGNIEILISEPSNSSVPITEETSKGFTQRLADFMLKT